MGGVIRRQSVSFRKPHLYLEVLIDGQANPLSLGRYRAREAREELEAWYDDPGQLANTLDVDMNDLVAIQIRQVGLGRIVLRRKFGSRWLLRKWEEHSRVASRVTRQVYYPRDSALLFERRSYDEPEQPVDLLLEYNARILGHPAVEGKVADQLKLVVGEMIQHRARVREAG
jgi:hypothetical protein